MVPQHSLKMNSQDSSFESVTPSQSVSTISVGNTSSPNNQEAPKPTASRTATCWYYFHYPKDTSVETLKCYYCKNPASSEQMESAKVEVLHYFEKFYKPVSTDNEEIHYNDVTFAAQQVADIDCIYKKWKLTPLFGNCEVTSYCALSPMDADIDILKWWKENSKLFPNLSKMAGELLSIPGTSVPSERVNSEARELLPYTRNRLGPEKIEATLVLKSYMRETGPGLRLLDP